MSGYMQRLGSRTGLRIIDDRTGETIVFAGRVMDNLSEAAANEIVAMLERRDRIRAQNVRSAYERNDLDAIMDSIHSQA